MLRNDNQPWRLIAKDCVSALILLVAWLLITMLPVVIAVWLAKMVWMA